MSKLSALRSSPTARLELVHPVDDEPMGVFVEGFTPDSREWAALDAKLSKEVKPQTMIVAKKKSDDNRVVIDPSQIEKREKLHRGSIQRVVGDDSFKLSDLNDPAYKWIIDQWGAYVEDRANFFGDSSKTAKNGAKSSGG